MTKPELARRLATIPHAVAMAAYKDILAGNGGSTLVLEHPLTVKQANALYDWHNRYGRVYPGPSDCQPTNEPPPPFDGAAAGRL